MIRCFPLLLSMVVGAGLATGCRSNLATHLTKLDGRTVEFATAGDAGPVVVFEAGLGNDWTTWDAVANRVSGSARVFAYSRPGYGGSEAAATPRDPGHIVEELRTLLNQQGYAPPYVLVGHSFGGAYMELFAKAHPSEVAALVLVEPRHRDFSAACAAAQLEMCGIPADMLATLPKVQIAEYEGYDSASEQIRAAGAFGAYPVRVLIATDHPPKDEAREALWKSMLTALAAEAADGQAVVFDGAGHILQAERTEEVARAILSVLPGTHQ
jgi:pimeloyl-ACP methyl ester carboxylesterase